MSKNLIQIDKVDGTSIYAVSGSPTSFVFKAGATIDADGAPNAYGPGNTGLDYTANAGSPGNWWGISCNDSGTPFTQGIYHPYPGMYVSTTALENPSYGTNNPDRYINSGCIPFIVLPGNHSNDAKLGDVCLCYNEDTGDNCFGIYADIGPTNHLGELSMRMADALSIDNNPKTGGTDSRIVTYLVFPGSVGGWATPEEWWVIAQEKMSDWGGLQRLKTIVPYL